jgi:exopolyphosphatase/pppGpp-phosphohydrolase
VSFKASLVPKDDDNRVTVAKGFPHTKLPNLLCLEVYRQGTLTETIVAAARAWFEEINRWCRTEALCRADEVLVVATAAFRDMELLSELEAVVRQIFNTEIHVLDGFVEAQLLVNAYGRHHADGPSTTLFDLGGGSLEIVCLERNSTHFTSLPLGAGRVTAWLLDGRPLSEVESWIDQEFLEKCQTIKSLSSSVWLGTGGAVRSFKKTFSQDSRGPIRSYDVANEVRRVSLSAFGKEDGCLLRKAIELDFKGLVDCAPASLPEHRKRIYFGGIVVLNRMCRFFGIVSIKLEGASLRNGALRLLQILRPQSLLDACDRNPAASQPDICPVGTTLAQDGPSGTSWRRDSVL